MNFSVRNRDNQMQKLTSDPFDVLIIGGGITGAGIALDAVTRGMKVALIDMQDFAAGTSSRSTKLVHGGLRYLKQLEIQQVAENGKERAIVYENGPHVTTPEWMLLPFHTGGTFGKTLTSFGLRVYDFLAGVNKGERRRMLTPSETLELAPHVKENGLKGGGIYAEYRTDDARLTIEVIKKAAEYGAVICNYLKADDFIYQNGRLEGTIAKDQLTGHAHTIRAAKIVNAAGPWVDDVREQDASKEGKFLKLSKGAHLVISQRDFPLSQSVYFDTPDGRMVFAIPREEKVYVGTTDTFYEEDPREPLVTAEDREYLLQAIRYMFPDVNVTDEDVESSWAGVRPLIAEAGKDPSEISRKDEIWESPSGLVTIAGGKLTGYRLMAERVVDLLAEEFKHEHGVLFSSSETKQLPIAGGDVGGSAGFKQFQKEKVTSGKAAGLTEDEAASLVAAYGSNAEVLFAIARNEQDAAIQYGLPIPLYARLKYALDHEMTEHQPTFSTGGQECCYLISKW